jgi:L-alanine-DL-glutamate epimerase-like enolase superfamily enzyme
MIIQKIEFFRIDMPLAVPYTIAYETVTKTSNIILKLITNKGIIGWGCASPDLEVTGESAEDVIKNMAVIENLLLNQPPFQIAFFNDILKQTIPKASSTLAMVDMALFDLMARKAKLPLYQLLGGYRKSIITSITIGIEPLDKTLELTKKFLKQGFSCIKLKGGLNLEEDIEKVRLMREIYGSEFTLRFDANQGFKPKECIRFMKETKNENIEILEQPTTKKREKKLAKLTHKMSIPVMADESLKTLNDAFHLANDEISDMVNIKIMKVGGISTAQHINSVAKAAGMEVMVGCLDECALGISAGLHFALSRPNIEYADLDGHLDLLEDPFKNLFQLKNGTLYPSTYYGLGKINL